jgi:NADH:ubiquinone oxidoreductase subunit B-like Fe-S oxidoreductase
MSESVEGCHKRAHNVFTKHETLTPIDCFVNGCAILTV